MIYSESKHVQRHQITLGKLNSQKTYTVSGNATFENGLTTFVTEGIQSVGVDIQPNLKFDPLLVIISSDASIVEVFCVLCPAGRYWNPDALQRANASNASEQLSIYDVTAGTRRLLSSYNLTNSANWMRDMLMVSDFTAGARLYCFSTRTGLPFAYRDDVNTVLAFYDLHNSSDERLMIFVSADRFFRYYNHAMERISTNYVNHIDSIKSAAFSKGAEYLAVVDGYSILRILKRNGYNFNEVYSNSEYEWRTVSEDGAYQQATRFRAVPNAPRSFIFDLATLTLTPEDWSAYGTAQTTLAGYPVVLTQSGVEVNGISYPLATPVASNSDDLYLATADGKVIDSSGAVILQASNPVAVLEGDSGLFVIEQNASLPAFTIETSAPQITTAVSFSETGITVLGDVQGGEKNMRVVSSAGTVYVDGALGNVAHPGSVFRIEVRESDLIGGKFALAIGRSAVLVSGIVDIVPDQFFIDDVFSLSIGDKRSIEIPLTGFNAETDVTSNGVIKVDGVISSTVSPNQTLTVEIQQSSSVYDTWWVTVGTTTAKFRSFQTDQPETFGVRGIAYAPLGVAVSDVITNTYGLPVLIFLTSDEGAFTGTSARELLLGVGQSCTIEVTVREHRHYDVPFRFGRSAHTFSVWADSNFLDAQPTTPMADRYVTATSDPFSFSSIPDNFYMIARTPAGVDVIIDGIEHAADQDARQVDKVGQKFELTNKTSLQLRGLPCSGGRTLDFGDCVARWSYPVAINGNQEVLPEFSVENTTHYQLALAANLITRDRDSVSEVDFGSLVAIGMAAFTNASRSEKTSFKQCDTVIVTVPQHSGLQFVVQASQLERHDMDASSALQVGQPLRASLDTAHYNIVESNPTSATPKLPRAVHRMAAEYDPSEFSLYQIPSHLAAAVNFRYSGFGAVATGQMMFPSFKAAALTPTSPLYSDRYKPASVFVWGTSEKPSDFITSVSYSVKIESSVDVMSKPNQAEMVTGHRAGLHYYDVESIPLESYRQDKLSVPLRPKIRSASGKGSGEIVLVAVDMKIVHSSNYAAYVPQYHSMQMLQWASLVGEYEARRESDVVDIKAQHLSVSVQHSIKLTALAVLSSTGANGLTGFDAVYASVHSYDWRGVSYVSAPNTMSYPRMEILTIGSITHNGNPNLLDRGYFSTEVLALQNAIQVWGMDPAAVAARQLPSGEWYWIQVTTCANMCQGCPPTGYLSGG